MHTAPPTILGHPSSTVVKEGEGAYFICQFRGPSYPVSQIQWLRNKVAIPARTFLTQDDQADGPILYPVVSSSVDANGGVGVGGSRDSDQQKPLARFVSFPENGTLKIEPVELTDAGDYTCEIMTPGYMTVESRSAQLFVTGMPTKNRTASKMKTYSILFQNHKLFILYWCSGGGTAHRNKLYKQNWSLVLLLSLLLYFLLHIYPLAVLFKGSTSYFWRGQLTTLRLETAFALLLLRQTTQYLKLFCSMSYYSFLARLLGI